MAEKVVCETGATVGNQPVEITNPSVRPYSERVTVETVMRSEDPSRRVKGVSPRQVADMLSCK